MVMIKTPMKDYDTKAIENKAWEIWKERDAYKKTKLHFGKEEDFYFVDGPPYTSGSIHMGTAWNKVLKDFYIRYKRRHGYNVRDQPGYDMHGLPIEVKVEKTLGIKNKKEIMDTIGIDGFIKKCKEFALNHMEIMTDQFKALGVWMDWDKPYTTITREYLLSAWWTLKRGHDKGLLKQKERVLTWCPRCQTALAEAEVEYWEESDPSIYVRFPIKDTENEYIIIWTTTPWTLPADLAVSVHPDFDYVLAKIRSKEDGHEELWWIIDMRLEEAAELSGFEVVEVLESKKGEEMEGMEYVHPLLEEVPYQQEPKSYWWHKVVLADYVADDYTGCVHTAPGHGPDDFGTGVRYQLPPFCPVDQAGNFTEEAGKYAGQNTKGSDRQIMDELKEKGLLLRENELKHRYGHCWRCKSPITYRATKQWFLLVTEVRSKMLEEIERVKWYPSWAGSSRFYDWVENTRDWCISRQRFWGIPIPIWRCEDCGTMEVIGTLDELEEKAVEGFDRGMDLHRPWIDKVKLECPDCGKKIERLPDILDVWFDSAVCSWAQLNYPHEEGEFKRWWPMNWITEAHDQTRGWFYSQLGASVVAFDRSPYDSVLVHGWSLDKEGRPMSKSLGNAEDPLEVGRKFGFDALRWFILSASAPWEDIPFNTDNIRNSQRLMNILWNSLWFSTTYMELDEFDPEIHFIEPGDLERKEDRWLVSRVNSVQKEFDGLMEDFQIHKALRAVEKFVLDDLSRFYIKLVRDRTWQEGLEDDKKALFSALYYTLRRLCLVISPVAPFTTQIMYDCLGPEFDSVDMEPWPEVEEKYINGEIEGHVEALKEVIESASHARQLAGIKLRWPIQEILVQTEVREVAEAVDNLNHILKEQLNAKEVKAFGQEDFEGVKLEASPVFSALGPEFKADANKVGELMIKAKVEEMKQALESGGEYQLEGYTIKPDMVEFKETISKGWAHSEFPHGRVFVPTELSPELKEEGMAREIIRRIQEMRKEMDLHLEEYINASIKGPEEIYQTVKNWEEYISNETRVRELIVGKSSGEHQKDWEIEGMEVSIALSRLGQK